jgi:hypothetical protein
MSAKIDLRLEDLGDDCAIDCTLCGCISEQVGYAAIGSTDGKDVVVCPDCLREGESDVDRKLTEHADIWDDHPERAQWLRGLIGRLALPSGAEFIQRARLIDVLRSRRKPGRIAAITTFLKRPENGGN